ncbi:MAG TPA: cyclic nucleotide-binding domain-containing protein [Caldithrix sp.]|nr:cyclic nucleotide-binding domain-containing protein [Caldithrix sp.]
MLQVFLNLGYGLMLIALAVREIFWLRTILIAAQLSLFTYAIAAHNNNVAFWNFLFFVINTYQVIRLLKERRPIEIPQELEDIYANVFSTMTRREFLYFWHIGSRTEANNVQLIKQGVPLTELYFILKGKVNVIKDGRKIAELGRGSFVAEMSFLTGEPASARVVADGQIEHISWKQEKIRSLEQLNPNLFIKIQNILGRDLAGKVKMASDEKN